MEDKKLVAFKNDPKLKEMLVEETIKHREADEIIQGRYESNGKFCAVGCSIESLNVKLGKKYDHSDHSVYETELGIPKIIARLEDGIFEGMNEEDAKVFPEQFISAIPVGADLSMVWPKFAVWLLGDAVHGVIKFAKSEKGRLAIQTVIDLYIRKIAGEDITKELWKSAAAYAAYAAAYAAYAADAAAYAADAAAYAAYAADAAAYAADKVSSRAQARKIQADKLVELLKDAPQAE